MLESFSSLKTLLLIFAALDQLYLMMIGVKFRHIGEVKMIVVASTNGKVGIEAASNVLRSGGSALDAVEAGIRLVEANPEDHTVGYSGLPSILGEVELDASIMDGQTLCSGAVGAVKTYKYPISIARKVMESLPHVFLVGEGAERFAHELGFEQENLLSDEATKVWREGLERTLSSKAIEQLSSHKDLSSLVRLATDPERTKGTVNFIAQDAKGNIATGVSTSGWAWKYPGRLGDSPVIGAGNYADNRYGAAACTGMGEMSIRGCTAFSLISHMKYGKSVLEAGTLAMEELRSLGGNFIQDMNIVALDKEGNHAAFSSIVGKTYIYQTPDMASAQELERVFVKLDKRWQLDS